jgi:hypothetical protein
MHETQLFSSFYVQKVSEMLRNTPKHHFWANVVEWMLLNFGAPKKCIHGRNTSFASFYELKVSEMLRNTPKHLFGSNVVEWILLNFGAPKKCIQGRNTSLHLFMCRRLAKCSKHSQTSFWVECRRKDDSRLLPWNSAFRPKTRVLHLFMSEG